MLDVGVLLSVAADTAVLLEPEPAVVVALVEEGEVLVTPWD